MSEAKDETSELKAARDESARALTEVIKKARDDVGRTIANLRQMIMVLVEEIPYGPDFPEENIFLYQEIEKIRRLISDESVYLDNIVRSRRLGLPQIPSQPDPEQVLASEEDVPGGIVPSVKNDYSKNHRRSSCSWCCLR